MTFLRPDDVQLGDIVFGRVLSFPWWPAIVGRSPKSRKWKDDEDRCWVFFFNDNHGAWLKLRDLRIFDKDTKDSLTQANNRNPKHRKHFERIATACELAEEYRQSDGKGRGLTEYSRTLTYSALDLVPVAGVATPSPPGATNIVGSTSLRRVSTPPRLNLAELVREPPSPVTGLLNSKKRLRSDAPAVYDHEMATSAEEETVHQVTPTPEPLVDELQAHRKPKTPTTPAEENQGMLSPVLQANQQEANMSLDAFSAGQRPRRKRKKSTRYAGFDTPFQTRPVKTPKTVAEQVIVEGDPLKQGTPPRIPPVILSLPRKNSRERSAKAQVAPRTESSVVETTIAVNSKEEKGTVTPVALHNKKVVLRINGSIVTGSQRGGSSSSKRPSSKSSKKLDLNTKKMKKAKKRHRKSHLKRLPIAYVPLSDTDNENVEKRTRSAKKSATKHKPLPSNFRSPFRRRESDPFRADNMGTQSGKERQNPRSDEHEIRSKANAKNIPPLMACAKEKQEAPGSTSPETEDIAAENQLIEMLMERISSMEEVIRNMHIRAGGGTGITAGQDSSGARLKYSIESLMEASERFATSRGFEPHRIARSMSQLWSDPSPDDDVAIEEARAMTHVRSAAGTLVWQAFQSQLDSKSPESKKPRQTI